MITITIIKVEADYTCQELDNSGYDDDETFI